MRLVLSHHPRGAEIAGPNAMLYDVSAGVGLVTPARVAGEALSWRVVAEEQVPQALLDCEVTLDASTPWLMRCDRVEFDPGGVAHRHTHPGPGIRYLLYGQITIESEGQVNTHGPGQAWFERGPDPVLATTSAGEPSAFARVLLLPATYAGQRTIRYVDPADRDKPKTQRASILCEAAVVLA